MQSAFDPDIARHRREKFAVYFGVLTTIVLICFAASFLHKRGLIKIPGLPIPVTQSTSSTQSAANPQSFQTDAPEVSEEITVESSAWQKERTRLLSPTDGIDAS